MKVINLLYLIPSLKNSGGMERVLTSKVNFLASSNKYKIFIATTEMNDRDHCFFEVNNDVEIINFELNFNTLFNFNIFSKIIETKKLLNVYEDELKKIILQKKIDICISMGGKELEFLGNLNLPCKKIYECHFEKNYKSKFLEIYGKNNFLWKIYGKIRDWQHFKLASKFDMVVVLSKGAFNDWKNLPNRTIIIANASPISLNPDFKIDLYSKSIISVGNLIAVKGYDLLIDAWALIAQNYPGWTLYIYGNGELKDILQKQINLLRLDNSVKLAGVTKNVRLKLEKSAFYVMSSRSEGLPMVLIESITCGLPIVAFDCETGPREIIENNGCGILVENGNIKKLAEAMSFMISSKEIRAEMSKKAVEKAKDYELNNIMEKWEQIFFEMTQK
jgi:glycosyltransferase involved in cell wall biosynthesis